MRIGLALVLLGVCFLAASQSSPLIGYVSSKGLPIHGAHIYNQKSKGLAISDPEGKFTIEANLEDVITISHVGYEPVHLTVDSLLVSEIIYVSLSSNLIQLEEVRVLFPTYEGFKEQVLAIDPEDPVYEVYGLDQVDYSKVSFPQPPSTKDPEEDISAGFGARFDLAPLTKKGREQEKLKKLLALGRKEQLAYSKFSREWVSSETNLHADELTDFMVFCGFSLDYLANTPLYVIRERMMTLLAEFRTESPNDNEYRYTPGA